MKFRILCILSLLIPSLFWATTSLAQCSICTKNAQQMGPEAAAGLNAGILFLMLVPLAGIIAMTIYVIKKYFN